MGFQLSVSESESVSLKVLTKTSATSCGHYQVTVEEDGQQTVHHIHENDIAEAPTSDTQRELVLAWLRYRQAKGKGQVGVRIV